MADRSGTPPSAAAPESPLGKAAAWNLSLSVLSKTQSLALLVAGAVLGGLSGVGIVTTAMGACYLGAALADFGLSSELGRLGVTHRTRATVDRCGRALAIQAPLGLLIAPAIFYFSLGHRTGQTPELFLTIGLLSSLFVATTGLTAILNGLGDFRSPAAWLGSARLASSFAAVGGAAVLDSPAAIIGAFVAGEAVGLIALMGSARRTRATLEPGHEDVSVVRRTHAWLGAASVINVLTNQSDTILVASILSPSELGLFGTASRACFRTAPRPCRWRPHRPTYSASSERRSRAMRRRRGRSCAGPS